MEDVKRLLIGAFASALIMLGIGILSQAILNVNYSTTYQLWKPMDSNWIVTILAYDIFVGLIVSFFYTIIRKSLSGPLMRRGINYGFFVWLVGPAAYILFIYLMMQVPNSVIILWLLTTFLQYLAVGIATVRIWEKENIEEKH